MSEIKEFNNIQQKDFYEIGTGIKEVDANCFSNAKMILRPYELMEDRRNEVIKLTLDSVDYVVKSYSFGEGINSNSYKVLIDSPTSFKIDAPIDSSLYNVQQNIRLIAMYQNDLYLNYKVCYKLMEFLFNRNNELTNKFNSLNKKYVDLVKQISNATNNIEQNISQLPEVKKDLILLEEEKKIENEPLEDDESIEMVTPNEQKELKKTTDFEESMKRKFFNKGD